MKTINITNPVKIITSNTIPTDTDLEKGELAIGKISGVNKIYGNTGTEILDFSNSDHSTLSGRDVEDAHDLATDIKSGFMSKEDKARQELLVEDIEYVTDDLIDWSTSTDDWDTMGVSANGTTYFTRVTSGSNSSIFKLDEITGEIANTGIPGRFRSICKAVDGAYFSSWGNGIFKLEDATGNLVPTNITSGNFLISGNSADGTAYFMGDSSSPPGIWKADNNTGDIVQTNITAWRFHKMSTLRDGTTYFHCHDGGLAKLDNDTGDIVFTNVSGIWYDIETSVAGINYITSASGIHILDDAGNSTPTNVNTGIFSFAITATNGITYFGSSINNGIYQLVRSSWGTWVIRPTNITTGSFSVAGTSADGTTFFGGSVPEIYKLDGVTGDIIPTNITSGRLRWMGTSASGITFFTRMYNFGILKYVPPKLYTRKSNRAWSELHIPKNFEYEILTQAEYDAKRIAGVLKDIIYFVVQP